MRRSEDIHADKSSGALGNVKIVDGSELFTSAPAAWRMEEEEHSATPMLMAKADGARDRQGKKKS